MSEQLTFIPASEAAEMVGVSAQTIRNLCKAKTLRYQMRTNLFYVCREDVEKYAQSISEINQIERDIDDYKKEINKAFEQIRDTKQEMQGRLEDMNMFPERIKNVTNLLISLLPHFSDCLSDREVEIVLFVLQGEKISDVAEKVKLSRDRTRQIWEKAIRKMSCFPNELQARDERIEDLTKTIEELEARLDQAGIDKVPHSKSNLLASPIYNFDFSVRTLNCLMAAEIRTVGDLVKHTREDLLKFRNFGKKSLTELDEWLADHRLAFAQYEEPTQEPKEDISASSEQSQNEEVYAPTIDIPLLERPIDYCKFTARTHNGLVSAEIEVVGDLLQMRRIDLQNIHNFGPKSVTEVEEWMTAHNLSLKENIHGPYVNSKRRKKRTRK